MYKKGMSPLIATVLLIAFAVALGAMIMNWSSGMEAPTPSGNSADPCRDVRIELDMAYGNEILCYRDNEIVFSVVNKGSREIKGIQLRTVDANLKVIKEELSGSNMIVGDSFDGSKPFDKTGKVHVELIPKIIVNNEPVLCEEQGIVQDVLPNCE